MKNQLRVSEAAFQFPTDENLDRVSKFVGCAQQKGLGVAFEIWVWWMCLRQRPPRGFGWAGLAGGDFFTRGQTFLRLCHVFMEESGHCNL
jgi:hypothetical protein